MEIKKLKPFFILLALAAAVFLFFTVKGKLTQAQVPPPRTVQPVVGMIEKFIAATATIQPQNRLEMKPPIGGRIDKMLVEEGQTVKAGDILAYMSSTDRAALLDAARPQGAQAISYWEEVYKPTPIIAPIDGQVIVKSVQPGQTVTPVDPIVVLSDRLIVEAQVDETDVGKIKQGQQATITLDAYPDIEVNATVGHIYYESQVVNNVTIYKVDILPEKVPDVFRSGMSANVRVIEQKKENVLTIPLEAVKKGKKSEGDFVLVSQGKNKKPEKREVKLGISDENNVEVVSGIDEEDVLVIPSLKAPGAKGAPKGASNPFMPAMGGQRKR